MSPTRAVLASIALFIVVGGVLMAAFYAFITWPILILLFIILMAALLVTFLFAATFFYFMDGST